MPEETPQEIYDAVILGTGVKESILAGLLSAAGAKILQMDASSVYGSSSRTIQYEDFIREMQAKFPHQKQFKSVFGEKEASKLYIDLTPKIFLADEGLIKIIAEHNLAHCIEFSIISEQYIVKEDSSSILIPTTKTSALTSNLCGPLQLLKLHKFVNMIKGFYNATDIEKKAISSQWRSVQDLYDYYGISESLRTIIGHGIALYTSSKYLQEEPAGFIMRLTTYFRSVSRINGEKQSGNSPFLYPKYGISEISQGFARLSAVKGGITRMSTEITGMERREAGYLLSLRADGVDDYVHTNFIIANDQYYATIPNSRRRVLRTARGVFILRSLPDAKSKQAMLLSKTLHSDIFLLVVGEAEEVCPSGYSIAYITAEYNGSEESAAQAHSSADPTEMLREIAAPAINQLYAWKYSIMQQFLWIEEAAEGLDTLDPLVTPLKPMDNTVDFRTVLEEVQSVYETFTRNTAV
ncbi:Rab GDP dissociation inhibitor [Nematocida major]|uniref:Rab GDP dissociation inhibitor n=1 Tax=Nematocida major TaxID=1912982 RepID=UPI002007DD48|nr:Rab GDP dissociation inhibitor [Nematocida major]KAH9386484.1 Rab GDP dissociation inhibitor [Nematocida major]